jgi:hypothetical protein
MQGKDTKHLVLTNIHEGFDSIEIKNSCHPDNGPAKIIGYLFALDYGREVLVGHEDSSLIGV